ncbi:hypothetical protein COV49_03255 [Candidatus Falkowbacteria bacterium CG11_big_fil_rev_8_21_14_0_20_39_10]|uniref:Nitroreductase domain-containing protein n=1 Tax=Candidatus Falkowbacteria bacterium CG11_big_fil_rev_8_21_14_0_20_39_10 TaxID=1974570 RepID=A0A2M6K8U8_9BACT|nr:MAG: hypothetical protein COV49_03255 [Candidatus Falkowbacteria bacterium CG11_big_fil_rev_8_21_14_0_20_39_10]
MDFWEVINKRKSVRSFVADREVSDEQIEKIIEAGKKAPSAGGLRPVEILVIKDSEKKKMLARAALGQNFITQAPAVIVAVVDVEKTASVYGQRGEKLYSIQDGAAAIENMLLAATALGLSSCWVGAFDEKKVKKILGLDGDKRPQAILPIGYEK